MPLIYRSDGSIMTDEELSAFVDAKIKQRILKQTTEADGLSDDGNSDADDGVSNCQNKAKEALDKVSYVAVI